MGNSKKSQGKEHKETQSPILKIFKDSQDPEKAILLKEKKEKRRKYFRKTDRSYDSSSTDRYKIKQTKPQSVENKSETEHGGVKETWWTHNGKPPKSADETCSCVSCALKKVLASEYTCVACLLVLFSASIVGAFLLVFKSSPMEVKSDGPRRLQVMKRQLSDDKRTWDGSGFGVFASDPGTREKTNTLDDIEGVQGDLVSVLNREKISESPNSEQLREFYKKLIETDAQIKKLKDSTFNGNTYERFRRSVLKQRQTNKHTKRNITKKRSKTNTEPDGVFVKEEKFVIKYGPIRRNYPKCSPHDDKQHEANVNHPFYKVSQRFDEMLNKEDNTTTDDVQAKRIHTDVKNPNARKLLQVDDEEEDLGYEDLNEVLADDKNDDDIDPQPERLKRDESRIAPSIFNLNWKGPMLYPDEVNAMIKEAALRNLQIPVTKSDGIDKESKRRELSDREYLEDYIDGKYDRLVGLAQAYSDYGVLDKENTKKPTDRSFSNGRTKKGFTSSSEGLRIEYRPGPANDNTFKKMLEKHVKIVQPLPAKPPKVCNARMNIHFFTDNNKEVKLKPDSTVQAININRNKMDKENPLKFKSRNLQSIDNEDTSKNDFGTKLDGVSDPTERFGLKDFVSVMADWFFKMADGSNLNIGKHENTSKVNTNEIIPPINDSDRLIGYRSRVLLQANVTDNITSKATVKTTVKSLSNKRKAIAKRDADFIFWNDIYDEEYGSKDYFDSTNKGLMSRSKSWLQEKLKVAADKIKYGVDSVENDEKSSRTQYPKYRPARDVESEADDVSKSFAELNANLKHVCREALQVVRHTRKMEDREDDSQATGLMKHLIHLMGELVDIQVQQKTCTKLPADLREFLEWLVAPDDGQPSVGDLVMPSHVTDGRYEKSPVFPLSLKEEAHQEDRTACLGTIRAVQDLIQQYEGMSDEDKSKMEGVREYLENQLRYLNRRLEKINENEAINYRKRETRNKRNVRSRRRRFFKKLNNLDRKHTKTTAHTKMTKAKSVTKDNVNSSKCNLMNKINNDNLINKLNNDNLINKFDNDNSMNRFNNVNSVNKINKDNLMNKINNDNLMNKFDNVNSINKLNNDNINNDNLIGKNTRNLKDVYFKALNEAKKTTVKKN